MEKRGPRSDEEWAEYSSHNIGRMQNLPMSELTAIKNVLVDTLQQGHEAMEAGEVPEEQKEFEVMYLDVTKKRLDIAVVAIM